MFRLSSFNPQLAGLGNFRPTVVPAPVVTPAPAPTPVVAPAPTPVVAPDPTPLVSNLFSGFIDQDVLNKAVQEAIATAAANVAPTPATEVVPDPVRPDPVVGAMAASEGTNNYGGEGAIGPDGTSFSPDSTWNVGNINPSSTSQFTPGSTVVGLGGTFVPALTADVTDFTGGVTDFGLDDIGGIGPSAIITPTGINLEGFVEDLDIELTPEQQDRLDQVKENLFEDEDLEGTTAVNNLTQEFHEGKLDEYTSQFVATAGTTIEDILAEIQRGSGTPSSLPTAEEILSRDLLNKVLKGGGIAVNVYGGGERVTLSVKLPIPGPDGVLELDLIRDGENVFVESVQKGVRDLWNKTKAIPGQILQTGSDIVEDLIKAGKIVTGVDEEGNIFDHLGNVIGNVLRDVGQLPVGLEEQSRAEILGGIIDLIQTSIIDWKDGDTSKYGEYTPPPDDSRKPNRGREEEDPGGERPGAPEPFNEEPLGTPNEGGVNNAGTQEDTGDGADNTNNNQPPTTNTSNNNLPPTNDSDNNNNQPPTTTTTDDSDNINNNRSDTDYVINTRKEEEDPGGDRGPPFTVVDDSGNNNNTNNRSGVDYVITNRKEEEDPGGDPPFTPPQFPPDNNGDDGVTTIDEIIEEPPLNEGNGGGGGGGGRVSFDKSDIPQNRRDLNLPPFTPIEFLFQDMITPLRNIQAATLYTEPARPVLQSLMKKGGMFL